MARSGNMARMTQKPANDVDAQDPASSPGDERESFGAWLQREREMRDVSLREIADASKISLRYLQALEDERFEILPAQVFAKGFLLQYARYVGLDPEETVNFFLAASRSEDEPDDTQPPPTRAKSFLFLLGALVLAVVLIAVAWGLTLLGRDVAEETEAPENVTGPAGVEAPGEGPGPEAAAPDGPEAAEPDATAAEPEPVPEAPLVVTVDFRGDCWVEATVDGEVRVPGQLGVQGESLRFPARQLVWLRVGDVSMIDLEVNGKPYTIDKGPAVRELEIDLAAAGAIEDPGD